MTGFAFAPIGLLILIGAAVLLVVCIVQLARGRRGGRLFAACMVLVLMMGAFMMLIPASMHSSASAQARLMHERAQLAAEEARLSALNSQLALTSGGHSTQPFPAPVAPTVPDGAYDPDELDPADEYDTETHVQSQATAVITDGRGSVHVESAGPARQTTVSINRTTYGSRGRSHSTESQIVSSVLLAGLFFAGYYFLNANTRGHYTWQLRVGSTVVFVAALVVIFVVGRHV